MSDGAFDRLVNHLGTQAEQEKAQELQAALRRQWRVKVRKILVGTLAIAAVGVCFQYRTELADSAHHIASSCRPAEPQGSDLRENLTKIQQQDDKRQKALEDIMR